MRNSPESSVSTTENPFTSDGFNLRDSLDTLTSQWRIILATLMLGVLSSLAYALMATPIYQADTLIQVEEKKGSSPAGIQQIATALDVSQSPVAGEIEILKSREVLGAAIAALHLDIETQGMSRVPYFSTRAQPGNLQGPYLGLPTLAWGGEKIVVVQFEVPRSYVGKAFTLEVKTAGKWELSDTDGKVLAAGGLGGVVPFNLDGETAKITIDELVGRPGEKFMVRRRSVIGAYDTVLSKLRVAETTRQSSVLRVTCEDDSREAAVSLCNEASKAYLLQNVSRRSEEAERSLEFLSDQLPQLQKEVEKSEQAFNAYRLQRQSVNLDKESEVLLNRSVDLEKQRVEAEMKGKLLAERFQPSHPDVQALDSQLGEIRGEEDKLSKEVQRLPETEQEFLRLQRDVKVNTDLYISLLNNAQQLRIEKAGTIGNVRVIDFATPADRAARPKRLSIIVVGTALGLFAGLFLAFSRRAFRPTLRNADEVERITGLAVYATVPESSAQRKLSVQVGQKRSRRGGILHQEVPDDPAIEALRGMRMGLQFTMVNASTKNIVITGPTSGIGKTFVSANLSDVLASLGKKVILIDCDMRRPRVADYFGLNRRPGLSNYLLGEEPLDSELVHKISENLHVLCSGTVPPNPGELLAAPEFAALLLALQSRYDYVLLDTPPLLPVGDTLAIAKLASAVLLLLRADVSTVPEVIDAMRKLDSAGVKVNGVVFNGVRVSRFGYGYSYHYQYSSYK